MAAAAAQVTPSLRSLRALDALYVILADVRGGLGPFLAVYLAAVHHWDPERIGTVLAVAGVAGLAAQTPMGALIDRTHRKRSLIAVALGVVGLGALAIVGWPVPAVVLSAQGVIGAAGSVFGPALAAVSLGLAGHAGFARRMGRNQALDHAGNVAAAALAGLIGDAMGYGAIFVMAAVMCLAGIGAALLIRSGDIDDDRARGAEPALGGGHPNGVSRSRAEERGPRLERPGTLLRDRRIVVFGLSVVLFHFANAAMLPLVGQKLTAGTTRGAAGGMSACIIAAQLVMIPVALAGGRLAESWGRKPTLLIAFAVLPVRGWLYTLSARPEYLVGVQLLDGLGAGLMNVVGVLIVADLTRGTGRFNLMQGGLVTATGLGAALSNVVTGTVVKAYGYDGGFLMLAFIAGLALTFFGLAMPESRPAAALDLDSSARAAGPRPADAASASAPVRPATAAN